MFWFVVSLAALIFVVAVIAIFNRFYHKGSRERALIRTGAGGQKIVMDGGCLVLPFLHQVESVDMRTSYIEIALEKNNSILTVDRMRVDLSVAFHVRVIPTIEGIGTAAQTVGVRSLNSERLIEFLRGRFVDALQSVVAERTMDGLHESRSEFVSETTRILKPSLEESGLKLESVSLMSLDQTEFSALNENNAFNAVGMRKLAEIVTANRRKRKEVESNADLAIRRTELDNLKSRILIDLEKEKAESEKTIEVELLSAETMRRSTHEKEQAQIASGQAKLTRELELKCSEIERDRQVRKAEVKALQAVEDARIQSQIELSTRRIEEAKAKADAESSRQAIIEAEESVQLAQDRLVAERTGEISRINAELESVADMKRAQSAAMVAKVAAESEKQVADLTQEQNRNELAVQVEGKLNMIEAENAMNASLIAMKLEEQRLNVLPAMAEKMSQPLEKIGDIRINHVSGLSSGSGGQSGNLGSVVDDVLDLAFRMPAIRKLGEAVGAEIVPESSADKEQSE